GEGELEELRPTDLDEEAARRRYLTFKEKTWDALQSLREQFFYHFINAEGSIAEVEQNILNEL
ncbi:MAG: nucleoside monophosphate kinase, partial [Akkermansiaceae bacterium]|nr:nucleoside monophosphate kinase [Akkermansiaceae bacterium]